MTLTQDDHGAPALLAPDQAGLARAVAALRSGEVVLYPTESYYGAAVDARSPDALLRLAQLKDRPPDRPFPLILSGPAEVERWAGQVDALARQLMDRYWPGPLTLVLPASGGLGSELTGERGVGLRCSSHPVAAALAAGLGSAITATSANRRGQPPVTQAGAAAAALPGARLVLDGGSTPGGPPSTVLAVAGGRIQVLRQGAIHVQQ